VSDLEFSTRLSQFIAVEIHTVEQLEILLLLSGTPHKWWSTQMVYEVVRSNLNSIQDRLGHFAKDGLLKRESGTEERYQFAPEHEDIWQAVQELREAYKARPVKVVQAIYTERPSSIEEFAKAFNLRPDK
jgi:hypothetical protein